MQLYAGIDLHSNNSFLVICQADDKVIYQRRLPNDINRVVDELSAYQEQIEGIVVESTYNWYWLVDGLQSAGYKVHLANTTAIKQYSGLKHTNDKKRCTLASQITTIKYSANGIYLSKRRTQCQGLVEET